MRVLSNLCPPHPCLPEQRPASWQAGVRVYSLEFDFKGVCELVPRFAALGLSHALQSCAQGPREPRKLGLM